MLTLCELTQVKITSHIESQGERIENQFKS